MSFPKAKIKRFNDIPVISQSPCSSAKKEKSKGFSSMFDRISNKTSSSEKDSAKSSKYRLFRTPSLPRRLKFRTQNSDSTSSSKTLKDLQELNRLGIKPLPTEISHTSEALEQANVEINNKTACLIESQNYNEELKRAVLELHSSIEKLEETLKLKDAKIVHLEREIESINQADELIKKIAEDSLDKIKQLTTENLRITKDAELEMIALSEVRYNLERTNEELQNRFDKIEEEYLALQIVCDELTEEMKMLQFALEEDEKELLDRDINIKSLSVDNDRLLDSLDKLRKQSEEDLIAYAEESQNSLKEIEQLKKSNSDTVERLNKKIAEINEENEMRFRELESIFVLEKSKITKDYNEKLEKIEESHMQEIIRMNEITEEKIRISEIQIEEKIKGLENSIENRVDNERLFWKNELEKCQKIAESEIMQSEYEKQDLKELLDSANELVRDKDAKIDELESQLKENLENALNSHEQCRIELEEAQRECKQTLTEKYNYQLTLNNTRSTINILMDRLKKSDTDVEYLTANKTELEQQCQSLTEEVVSLKTELEEYRIALTSLHYSSSALESSMTLQENVLENLMVSEEEAIKIFNQKIEESIMRHFEMYNELKKKYDLRDTYIKDMKCLLDEFAMGIEIARIEIEAKNTKLLELEQENKEIKLENMTYKFKCEQFERYEQHDNEDRVRTNTPEIQDNEIISNLLIENIINQLEKEDDLGCGGTKIDSVNLTECNLKLKNQIQELTDVNKQQETKITELKQKMKEDRTPLKLKKNLTPKHTPKTPKTPIKMYAGKENSPAPIQMLDSPKNILRQRNN